MVIHLLIPILPLHPPHRHMEHTQLWGLLNDCQVFQERPHTAKPKPGRPPVLCYPDSNCGLTHQGPAEWVPTCELREGPLNKMSHTFVPVALSCTKQTHYSLFSRHLDSIDLRLLLFKVQFQVFREKQSKSLSKRGRLSLLLLEKKYFSRTIARQSHHSVSALARIRCAGSVFGPSAPLFCTSLLKNKYLISQVCFFSFYFASQLKV